MAGIDSADRLLLDHLSKLGTAAIPTGFADIAALSLITFCSAAYLLRRKTWDKPNAYHHLWYERPQAPNGVSNGRKKTTRNIASMMEERHKDFVVFWGSQSGTAEAFAERLARECYLRFNIEAMAADLSDYDVETIAMIPTTKVAIFVLSTFGEGDPSDNTHSLWQWLHESELPLTNLRYLAFGLGNSNYQHYNRVVDVVAQALQNRGATPLMPVGRADDAEGGTEEDFMAWKDELFRVLQEDLAYVEQPMLYKPSVEVIQVDSLQPMSTNVVESLSHRLSSKTRGACSKVYALKLNMTQELFTSSSRNCLHMEFDISDYPELRYKTGDHLAVWPINPDEEVDMLLQAFALKERRDTPILVMPLGTNAHEKVPSPTTPDALFRHYLDICGHVSRDTILGLTQFAPGPGAKACLKSLSSDKLAYKDFLSRNHLTIGRLLRLATASEPTSTWPTLGLCYLIDVLPSLQPRYYSISSSSVISPRHPSITALISSSPLLNDVKTSVPGLASNYLFSLPNSSSEVSFDPTKTPRSNLSGPQNLLGNVVRLHAHLRRSKFKLPTQSKTPLVMIAAGTGVAPFRAFIAERIRIRNMGRSVGEMILFFGCRNPCEDFIYREELESARQTLEDKLEIITAFSRVEGEGKLYVQDQVKERASDIIRLMEDGANVYICGRANMARDVGKTMVKALSQLRSLGDTEAREWCETAKRRGKWQEDVWG